MSSPRKMTQRCHRAYVLMVPAWLVLNAVSAVAQPTDVAKTNPLKVYAHYLPWFETPATLGPGKWGYHWKLASRDPNVIDAEGRRQIASHYYPKIGPYASSDADVIEYHLLLMKLSGIDGVLIDWYGVQGTNRDVDRLLSNSDALVDCVDDVGLQFGMVLEDRFSANIDQAKANVAYARKNYFSKPEYIRIGKDGKPLLLVFGPIKFEQQNDWTQILAEAGEPVDFLPLWYESRDAGNNTAGEFAWIFQDRVLDNHLKTHQSNYYVNRTPMLDVAGGVAYPGFDDYYEEGGVGGVWPFVIPHKGGQTLDSLLDLAATYADRIDFLQLATFNDFGEGTIFEPTVETGFQYLKKIQEFTGTPYDQDELQLVYRLYVSRKRFADNEPIQAKLDLVVSHLVQLEIGQARDLLETISPAGDEEIND